MSANPFYDMVAFFGGRNMSRGIVVLRQLAGVGGRKGWCVVGVRIAHFQDNVFRWRKVRRLGIVSNQFHTGSIVFSGAQSGLEMYGWRILVISAAALGGIVFIVLLLRGYAQGRRSDRELLRKESERSEAQRLAQVDAAVRESEKRFRLMVDSAPVLMWISGPDKLRTDFNKEWLTFTGRTMREELGKGWLDSVHPNDLQGYVLMHNLSFESRQSFTAEFRLRRHDDEYRWMLDRGVPRFQENGEFAGYIGCCVDITDQKEAKATQAALSSRLIQTQEVERARIARDLHDDINQRLALLANGLLELEQTVTESNLMAVQQRLSDLWRVTNEIVADIQHLSHQLHPSKLHYLGLASAVRDLCQEFAKMQKIEVECLVRDVPRDLDETVSLSLFRTIQESLRNVAKHSSARHVKIDLFSRMNGIFLRVSDDGVGFDTQHEANSHGLGLVSMRERLQLIGGKLTVWSRPSLGTQVEASLPVTGTQARTA